MLWTADNYAIDPMTQEVYFYPLWATDKTPCRGLPHFDNETRVWTGYHGVDSGPLFSTREAVEAYINQRHPSPTVIRALIPVNNCTECPKSKSRRTPRAGCATDYLCTEVLDSNGEPRVALNYIEWPSEIERAGGVPKWCPYLRTSQQ